MVDVSEETLDDLDIDFAIEDDALDEGVNRRSNKDRQLQSRRRIEELMEQKRLKMQLGDFDDYDFPIEH